MSPVESFVAVAITNSPASTEVKAKDILSRLSVVTILSPRKVAPSPKGLGMFGAGLEKTLMVEDLLGRLLSLAAESMTAGSRGPCGR